MAKEKKGPVRGKIPVRTDVLTEAERVSLTAEAQKSVAAEMAQDARDAYFASELARIRRGHVPDEQLVHVTIDAAPFVPHIMLDHVLFYHGYTYEVPMMQAAVLYEQMQRSWQHQDEIDGRGRTEAYRRPRGTILGPRNAGTPTRGVNGTVTAEI